MWKLHILVFKYKNESSESSIKHIIHNQNANIKLANLKKSIEDSKDKRIINK